MTDTSVFVSRERLAITDIRDEFVVCRAIGHSWDDNPTGEVDSDLFRASTGALVLRCVRCTTERFDYLDETFHVYQRYYRYPPNYSTIAGQGTRPNLRGELIRRSLLVRTRGNGRRRRGSQS